MRRPNWRVLNRVVSGYVFSLFLSGCKFSLGSSLRSVIGCCYNSCFFETRRALVHLVRDGIAEGAAVNFLV